MEPVFRERRSLRLMGVALTGDGVAPFILLLWVKFSALRASVPDPVDPHILYGVWRKTSAGGRTEYAYMVGVETATSEPAPGGLETWELPPGHCAVFTSTADMTRVVRAYHDIGSWFESGTIKPATDGYVVEVYDSTQPIDEDYTVEIWEGLAD